MALLAAGLRGFAGGFLVCGSTLGTAAAVRTMGTTLQRPQAAAAAMATAAAAAHGGGKLHGGYHHHIHPLHHQHPQQHQRQHPRSAHGVAGVAGDRSGSTSGGPLAAVPERIGFIGAGQMGEALIRGFISSRISSAGKIAVCVKTMERVDALQRLGIGSIFGDATEGGAADVAAFSSIIFLGTKPQAMKEVMASLAPHVTERHLVVSIAAGITLQTMEAALGQGVRVVRVMPNTPCLVQSGASAYALGTHATPRDADTVHALLSSVGFCIQVEEKHLDAVTGLSGSGPAFVYLMIEALADGGVAAGLPRDTALALAAKTVAGAAQMVFSEDESSVLGMVHPGVLKDRVASPAGTTIAGLLELESSGVRGAFMRAVKNAAQRSKELAG